MTAHLVEERYQASVAQHRTFEILNANHSAGNPPPGPSQLWEWASHESGEGWRCKECNKWLAYGHLNSAKHLEKLRMAIKKEVENEIMSGA